MSRFEPKKPSLCTSGPLLNDTFRESLSVLHAIVKSCYGPFGRLKQLHNGIGGCVTTTSQSHALLSGFSVRHPAVKLIAASICNHISTFSDCGLFAANLCCNLIDQFTNLNISPHTIIRLSKHILNLCITYLKSEDCACKMAVDFSNSKSLLSVAYSVVSSKPACMLTANEANYISTLAVKAFLLTVPNDVGSSVTLGKSIIVPVEGEDVMGSSVVSGLLIEMSDYYLTRELPSTQLTTKPLKVALFSISLSGDFCETGEGTLDVFDSVNPDIVMLDQLFALGKQLVDDHVMLLLCQKVIHPALKQYLKEQDVFAVDRLGAAVMEPLSQMTGAKPIASLSPVSSTCYGDLKNVSKLSYGFKHFLHLIPFDTSICSFVLCNRNETSLKELMLPR
ncbi:molecular chaperone MKKS-like [Bombina bombina]|uniref:molecular chaperone MKKS-like n=1 Tax=Bombina bombina TaxID=8345 RepID=UPI00235A61BC|nr:molecular chaperone MKKS-like [Bombina bombina]